MNERCGDAAGLYAVTHAMAVEHGFLPYWRSRARWSLPWLTSHSTFQTVCWQPNEYSTDEPCQLWTLHIAEQGWERVSESYRGLMAHVRKTSPELCEQ